MSERSVSMILPVTLFLLFRHQKYPSIFSSANLPLSNHGNIKGLLWQDLDGAKTEPNIKDWIRENLLGCGPDQLISK